MTAATDEDAALTPRTKAAHFRRWSNRMKTELTPDEQKMLARILGSEKGDTLFYDLSMLIPSFLITGFGIYLDSNVAIITGMVVYAGFALRTTMHQEKSLPVLKSLLEKLTQDEAE